MKRIMRWCAAYGLLLALSLLPQRASAAISFNELMKHPHASPTHVFAYGNQPDQFGELWLPAGNKPHPVVVLIHGGCWLAKYPGTTQMFYLAEDLRKSGFAVWNLEYRRLGASGSGYPSMFMDIADGMDYLRRIEKAYRLDLNHVVVAGHSAGGHLALWASARGRIPATSPLYRAHPLAVRAVASLAGIPDLEAYRNGGARFCDGPRTIDRLVDAQGRNQQNPFVDTSPAAMLPLGVTQFIASGEEDPVVPPAYGDAYVARAQKAGDRAESLRFKSAGHFEMIDARSNVWTTIKARLLEALK